MKKRLLLLGSCFIFCNFLPPSSKRSYPTPAHLSKQLLEAHTAGNMKSCGVILRRAADVYKEAPDAYLAFLNGRTSEGFTLLQYCSATSDYQSLTRLIKRAENFFGAGHPSLTTFLNLTTKEGHTTALLLAAEVGDAYTLKLFLEYALSALNNDKKLFSSFITTPHPFTKSTPLHKLVEGSSAKGVKILVQKAATLLGKDSPLFEQFINAQDASLRTPLSYAIAPEIRHYLMSNGALIKAPLSEQDKAAHALGQELIDAVRDEDFVRFQKILEIAHTTYSANKDLFLKFFLTHDQEGWTAYMHSAAHNQVLFLTYFFNFLQRTLGGRNDIFHTILTARDREGKSALILALIRKHFAAAHLLIDKANLITTNKLSFYMIINTPEEFNSRTPLLCATYNSPDTHDHEYYNSIKLMIELMKQRFKLGSHAFHHFINAEDRYKATALSYANSPRLRKLLIENGAVDSLARTTTGMGGLERTQFVGVQEVHRALTSPASKALPF